VVVIEPHPADEIGARGGKGVRLNPSPQDIARRRDAGERAEAAGPFREAGDVEIFIGCHLWCHHGGHEAIASIFRAVWAAASSAPRTTTPAALGRGNHVRGGGRPCQRSHRGNRRPLLRATGSLNGFDDDNLMDAG